MSSRSHTSVSVPASSPGERSTAGRDVTAPSAPQVARPADFAVAFWRALREAGDLVLRADVTPGFFVGPLDLRAITAAPPVRVLAVQTEVWAAIRAGRRAGRPTLTVCDALGRAFARFEPGQALPELRWRMCALAGGALPRAACAVVADPFAPARPAVDPGAAAVPEFFRLLADAKARVAAVLHGAGLTVAFAFSPAEPACDGGRLVVEATDGVSGVLHLELADIGRVRLMRGGRFVVLDGRDGRPALRLSPADAPSRAIWPGLARLAFSSSCPPSPSTTPP